MGCSCRAFQANGSCRHLPPSLGGLPVPASPARECDAFGDAGPSASTMVTDLPAAESPAEERPSTQKVVVDVERIQWYMKENKILAPRAVGSRCGLFLDVDGVLHPLGAYGGHMFCHLSYLFQIIEATGCDVVLSSSWRLDPEGIQEINDRLTSKATLLDVLPKPKAPLNDLGNRDVDIQSWLAAHADE